MVDIVPVSEIYDGLTAKEVSIVQAATKEIRISGRIVVRAMVAMGKKLDLVKPILIKNGKWRQWLKENFDASHDTADRYIKVAKNFGDLTALEAFDKAALYLLADDDTPQAARDLALQRAEQGERITRQIAAEIANTFQKAAVSVIEEALTTEGHVSLNGVSIPLVETVDDQGKTLFPEETMTVITAAVTQKAAEQIEYERQRVITHIERRNAHQRRTVFLKVGGLDDFQKVMKSGEPKRFKGKLFISMWGIPEGVNGNNSSGTDGHDGEH